MVAGSHAYSADRSLYSPVKGAAPKDESRVTSDCGLILVRELDEGARAILGAQKWSGRINVSGGGGWGWQ